MPEPRERYLGRAGEAYARDRFSASMAAGRRYQSRIFAPLCAPERVVLDFGCGDGAMLSALPARRRIGIEINAACFARIDSLNETLEPPIEVKTRLEDVRDATVDVAILNHSLEHVADPLTVLRAIRRVLAPGGRLGVVTPFDDWRAPAHRAFRPDDPDGHLFTWSPLDLGNLVAAAGFEVESATVSSFAWSPRILWVRRFLGERAFRAAGRILAFVRRRREVICLARRPESGPGAPPE